VFHVILYRRTAIEILEAKKHKHNVPLQQGEGCLGKLHFTVSQWAFASINLQLSACSKLVVCSAIGHTDEVQARPNLAIEEPRRWMDGWMGTMVAVASQPTAAEVAACLPVLNPTLFY